MDEDFYEILICQLNILLFRYFYTFQNLPEVETPKATPFKLQSAAKIRHKIIPFKYIYITSVVYFRKIQESLGDQAQALKVMNKAQEQAVSAHESFPQELKDFAVGGFSNFKQACQHKDKINIIVINGIGTGFGDNFVGLGAIQRLQELCSPTTVNVYLMNNANRSVEKIYMRSPNVYLLNNCVSLKQFMKMDFFINLTAMVGFPEFEKMPLLRFMADQFLVNEESTTEQLQPNLALDNYKLNSIKQYIRSQFSGDSTASNSNQNPLQSPLVLFHPQASTPIRNIPKKYADSIITALIAHGFRVVTAIPYTYPEETPQFCSVDPFSTDVDDLVHIIECCDAVVSVGTVVYHLSAALNKPTMLMPTVEADVNSGKEMPQVTTWVPTESERLILKKHKGRDEADLATVEEIWKNIDPVALAKQLLIMCHSNKEMAQDD